MDLGRDYFPAAEYVRNYQRLAQTSSDVDLAIIIMMGTVPLPDYLSDGLAKLAAEGLDIDNLNPARVSKA
jgi:hypothetical protein